MRSFLILNFFLAIASVSFSHPVFSDTIYTGHSAALRKKENGQDRLWSNDIRSESYANPADTTQRLNPLVFLFGSGYRHDYKYKREYIEFNSLLRSVFYNTVEGFGADYAMSYIRITDTINTRYLRLTAKVRYGFSNKKFSPLLSGDIPARHLNIGFVIGADIENLNNQQPISMLANTVNSLIYERNYLKLFQKKTAAISINRRLYGGLTAGMGAGWESREWLSNTTDYKWRNVKKKEFTSNNPFYPASDIPLFPTNQAFKLSFSLSYNFSDKYIDYPAGKYYLPSRYPILTAKFTQSVRSIFGSDVSYSLLEVDLSKHDLPLGIYGRSSFYLGAGKFLSSSRLYFTDFKHFNGNRIFSYQPEPNKFIFLDYYRFSTDEKYVEGHVVHNFSGLFLNNVPLIKKLKLQEIAGLSYLATPALKNYTEVYAGLSYLTITAQYGVSFNGTSRCSSGIRIAVRL